MSVRNVVMTLEEGKSGYPEFQRETAYSHPKEVS